MAYDSIIFDLDGTLWNACYASAEGWNNALEGMGISIRLTGKDIEIISGHPFEECVRLLLPGLDNEHPDLFEAINRREREAIENEGGELYTGVIDGIKAISGSYDLFLVSNCQEWYLDLFIQKSRLGPYFRDTDCYGKSLLSKGEMLARIRDAYSLKHPVYVGDTAGDQRAAQLAGLDFIHALYGFGKPEAPCMAYASFTSLVSALLISPRS